jgi:plasmid stabilization system protein ParE
MTFRVATSRRAERDARRAYRWLAERAPEAAHRWYRGLREAISSLESFPQRCPLAPENAHFPEEIRHLCYGRRQSVYRILYTIRDDEVIVLPIRHGAQQPLTPETLLQDEEDNENNNV